MNLSYDDQAVERGAKALWNRGRAGFWEEAPTSAKEHYRIEARAVLAAALAASGTEPCSCVTQHGSGIGASHRFDCNWGVGGHGSQTGVIEIGDRRKQPATRTA